MGQEIKTKKKRIFDVAKELNISHIEIISFLKKEGIPCKTIMTPLDDATYLKVMEEFAKEKDVVERIRKEKARKEAEAKRKEEEEARQKAKEEKIKLEKEVFDISNSFVFESIQTLLKINKSIEAQLIDISLGKSEKKVKSKKREKRAEKVEEKAQGKKKNKFKKAKPKPEDLIIEESESNKKKKKKKLKRIAISEIEEKLGQKGAAATKGKGKKKERKRKGREVDDKKVEESIKKTMAKLDEKSTKKKYKKKSKEDEEQGTEEKKLIQISEFATVETLANLLKVDSADIIQKCIELGMFVTINQRLDFDSISIIADDFNFIAERVDQYAEDIFKVEDTEEDLKNAKPRPPVVVIMGHVDHGKTSLLDYIRKDNVVAGESGGITQHIGAYQVNLKNKNQRITFLDTPGHEAFTTMRARGARVTDIVILVVAADDGVMPRTIEAINHAKAAEVPIIVAINKIDRPEADVEKVKRGLSEYNILVESWGGDIQSAEISALTGQGVDYLLDLVLLESEILELKANADTIPRGTVVEAQVDRRHGPMATILLQKGSLKVSDPFVCGAAFGRVRALFDERGKKINLLQPGDPAVVVGFDIVPNLADVFTGVKDEKEARKIATERKRIQREELHRQQEKVFTLDAISAQIAEGERKQLNIILKTDVDGSAEAIKESLQKIGNEEVSVAVKHQAAGEITESDILLAKASDSIVIGFNILANPKVKELAKTENVEIRRYRVIYELLDDIKSALEGLLTPDKIEEVIGSVAVRTVFKIPVLGNIAGSYVEKGIVQRNAMGRLTRDGEVLHDGEITSLKRFKNDVKEVKEGFECGLCLEKFSDYQEGDKVEVYDIKSVKRKLK